MTINFKTGSSGWANYVLNGTKEKPREKEKIKVIDGDPHFTEKIASQNKFSGEYYKVLITVEKKLTNEEMKNIYEEVKKNIFVGFNDDEYMASAVIHQDTEHSHIHMIIPKQNLLTGQHLQLYMQGIDTKRIQALQDNTALKFGLKTIKEVKPIVQEQKQTAYEKNRNTPVKYTLQDKKSKALAQQQITELIKDNIQSINSIEDIKEFIEAHTDLEVVKTNGYDRKKDFHYITIQDKENKKTTVKGKLFSKDFFEQPKSKQVQLLQLNHKTYSEVEKELLKKKIKADLRRENEKRYAVVQKQGTKIKAQKRAELQELQNKIQKEKRNENPRRTTTPSPRRSQRSPSTKPTNNNYVGARESRKREREARARAREERIASYTQYNSGTAETDTRSLVREYKQLQIRHQREQRNRGIIRKLFEKISTITNEFFSKIAKIEEKTKLLKATQSPLSTEESATTEESPQSKEELQKDWEKLVKSAKKLTHSNPKLSH